LCHFPPKNINTVHIGCAAGKKLTVEKINGQEAAKSDYASRFKEHGFENDRGRLVFW